MKNPWRSSLSLLLLTPGLFGFALNRNDSDPSFNLISIVTQDNLADRTSRKNDTLKVTLSKQFYRTASGIYRYDNLGSINETIYLPNGDNIETWVARYNFSETCPYYMAGWDEENRPVWVLEFGKWDVKRIIEAGHLEEFSYYALQGIHFVRKSITISSTPELPVHKYIVVVDFDNLLMDQLMHIPTVTWCSNLAREYNDIATKEAEEAIIINENYVAYLFTMMIKPILGSAYANIHAYGNKKMSWMPHLFRRIPVKYIPPWYGGNKDFKPVKVLG